MTRVHEASPIGPRKAPEEAKHDTQEEESSYQARKKLTVISEKENDRPHQARWEGFPLRKRAQPMHLLHTASTLCSLLGWHAGIKG